MSAFIVAGCGHEGFGANGGTGHESLAHSLASQRDSNPRALVEDAFAMDEATLRAIVQGAVWGLNSTLSNKSNDHDFVTGNYPGGAQVWYWNGVDKYLSHTQAI